LIRKGGFGLLGLGALVLVWVGVTVKWGDPFTSLYTRHEQRALAGRLDQIDRQWAAPKRPVSVAVASAKPEQTKAAVLRSRASSYRSTLAEGAPIGRIVVPRLGLRMVVVEGTAKADLEKGPGHYDSASGRTTGLPGMGGVIGIAGHRTTYSAPFRHIDDLRPGDKIELRMPYGHFRYTVYHHKIVDDQDWSILRKRPWEKLVLTACHPLYSAKQRWVVFARLTSRTPI
jgi:sortase A